MDVARWEEIKELYHTTLERPTTERAAFLAATCGADTELRREVELLLAANEKASDFLKVPAMHLAAQGLANDEEPTQQFAPAIGQSLSHYKILSRIGAGGMGEVYLARDAQLKRRVALKLLPLKFTQDAVRLQRFIREAETASALNHPNIITIYEIGVAETEHGQTHFIATEYIEGVTLRDWRPEEEIQRLSQTLELGSQIASALDAAHHAGIVHRDIKPENLMIRPDGLVKVLDFGLAKLTATNNSGGKQIDTDAQTTPEEMQTLPGMVLGTLRYMSPEQARGRVLDARTDIFSLGVVLYELLTGKPLFEGETTADVIAEVIHKEMPPLSEFLPDAPPELERILRKALAKDSRNRYQTARDLQIDMRGLKQESELSARLARSGPLRAASSEAAAQSSRSLAIPRFTAKQVIFLVLVLMLLSGALWWLDAQRSQSVETPLPMLLKHADVVTWQSTPGEVYSTGSFSPDGKWIAFTSTQGGSKNIWVKQIGTGDAEPSTKDGLRNENPIWLPNGDEIAFYSPRGGRPGIWRKPPFGGIPRLIKQLASDEGSIKLLLWSKDGSKIYYESKQNLYALDINTNQTKQLTSLDGTYQVNANTLSISPDEQKAAFISSNEAGVSKVYVLPLRGGLAQLIAHTSGNAQNTVWHPDAERVSYSAIVDGIYQIFVADLEGHQPVQLTFGDKDSIVLGVSIDGTKILYSTSKEESDLWSVKSATAGESVAVADLSFKLWPAVSPSGLMLAYQSVKNLSQGNKLLHSTILIRPVDSVAQPAGLMIQDCVLPKWSPDGKRLAFLRLSNKALDLWTSDVIGGQEKQLTNGGLPSIGYSIFPYQRIETANFDWTTDSRQLVYSSRRSGVSNLWLVNADDANDQQITDNQDSNRQFLCPLWSPDGKRLAYASNPKRSTADGKITPSVWVNEVEKKNSKIIFESESFLRLLGWSPNGEGLIVATLKQKLGISTPTEVQLLYLSTRTGESRPLMTLSSTYLYNIHLSTDKRMIAFTARRENEDNIWVFSIGERSARRLTDNRDPRYYFSSLAWAPDGRTIYFGKQMRYSQLSMISNFK